MEITVFAKKRKTSDGKSFFGYISTLTRKDGESITVSVKFRDDCGAPKPEKCPVNIEFDKKHANLSSREYIREDSGEIATSYTLWVNEWKQGAEYVDKSLDDFE